MFPNDRITVCIVGRVKAIHFQLHYLALGGIAVILAGLVIGAAAMSLRPNSLVQVQPSPTAPSGSYRGEVGPTRQSLLQVIERSREELKAALQEKEALRSDVAASAARLAEMSNNLQTVEHLVGVPTVPGRLLESPARLHRLKQVTLRNAFILEHVPSGAPVAFKGVSSPFGLRAHPLTNERKMHEGVDLRADYDTPVIATADGVVEFAGYQDRDGYGRLLTISHDFGFKTNYAHLSRFAVRLGDYVKKGQVVAHSGSSGMSSGPHLHYEVTYLQHKLDPAPFLHWSMSNFDSVLAGEKSIKWDSLIALAAQQSEKLALQLSESQLASSAN